MQRLCPLSILALVFAGALAAPSGARAYDPPSPEAILTAISDNLLVIQSVTADMDCLSSPNGMSFVDGYFAAEGFAKTYIDKGTLGCQIWRDDTCLNYHNSPERPGGTTGLRWNDSLENAYGFWARYVGVEDPRVIVSIAMSKTDLVTQATTENINGTACYRVSGAGIRFWVDAGFWHRLVQYELDFEGTTQVAYSGKFLQWGLFDHAEFPAVWALRAYNTEGALVRWWRYELFNIQTGGDLNDDIFETWLPPDTSELTN